MLGPSTAYDLKTKVIIKKAKNKASNITPAKDKNSRIPELFLSIANVSFFSPDYFHKHCIKL